MKIYRQGDILIKSIDEFPKGVNKIIDGVLVKGESTGHAHKLIGGSAFVDKNGFMYLSILYKAQLVHEEHKPINLSKGKYVVVRQKEYMSKDMTRVVQD